MRPKALRVTLSFACRAQGNSGWLAGVKRDFFFGTNMPIAKSVLSCLQRRRNAASSNACIVCHLISESEIHHMNSSNKSDCEIGKGNLFLSFDTT